MLVLHGFWSGSSGVGLWAEDSDRAVKSPSQALRSARPHPFAAAADEVAGVHAGKPGSVALLLPSVRSAPLDSPELLRVTPRPAPRTGVALLPWTVPVVWLDAAAALSVFDEPVSGVRYGASVGHLARLAAFARDLVERGRLLPALSWDEHGPVARWQPVVTGPDVVAVNMLAAAMPPAGRAEPAEPDPHELVMSALAGWVDAVARSSLSGRVDLVPARRGRRPGRLPAAEAWLSALTAPDGRFEADPQDAAALGAALRPWEEFRSAGVGPARAMFRLSAADPAPPGTPGAALAAAAAAGTTGAAGTAAAAGTAGAAAAESGAALVAAPGAEPAVAAEAPSWWLEFLLQSVDDPSLLIPADQVWDDDGSLRRWLDRPQELLLAELGRASRVYPRLAAGLRSARPRGLELDTEGAAEFLSGVAGLLDTAGFGVQLPSWWDRRKKLGLALSARTPVDGVVAKAAKFGRDQLVEFRWELALGDETLTEAEITALAEAKAPLVRLRGQWVTVDAEQVRRGLEFLRRGSTGHKTVAEIMALAAAHPADVDTPLELTSVRADGWLGDLLAGTAAASIEPVEPPAGLTATLRPYQQRGLAWLAFLGSLGLGCCLADDMGLGKTVQLLALEAVDRERRPAAGPTLLLCPVSLVGNWQREAARFTPGLRVYAHHGAERLSGEQLAAGLAGADLVVTTYATATRDMDELAGHQWRRVVLDEAQAVKNSLSRSAKAVRRLVAGHRVALTGTPVENRLAELWSIMDFVNPGVLGSAELFRTRYAIPVERHGQTEPAQRLRAVTRPYLLRRLKTDPAIIQDLPEKIEIKQYCRLTTEQASLYQSVVDDMMDRIEHSEGIERRGNVLAAMAKLKQVCNHPAHLLHDRSAVAGRSGKVLRLEEILEEILAEGHRALCFTQYTGFAELLLPHLAARFDQDVAYLHGGTPKKRRDELVARFQAGDGPPVFLLSLRAGGTGLNLTAANHVLHLDRWWNPAVENQATDRAYRIGQQRTVQVHKFICTGTLEERIDEMIEEKKALADLVVTDGEGWLTELSTRELRTVFALSEDAAGE
jgi:SNF2 family DNA or RNA helicase